MSMNIEKPDRRELITLISNVVLFSTMTNEIAWAGGMPLSFKQWLAAIVGLKEDLIAGRINVLQWQDKIERLNQSLPTDDIYSYLDIENLSKKFEYKTNLADMADPLLPREIIGEKGMKQWFVRIFAMRKGGAIIPHVHNNMVSSHLCISGSFHARTHDRIQDLEDAIVLKPTMDGTLKKGKIISMSDQRNNQHWLIAREDRSMTLDVGIVRLPQSWEYGIKANEYNMIYVDPTPKPQKDGNIIAPILNWEKAAKKFANFED
jgi:hypothetical protein